jgi:hypothetical protein
MNNFIYHVYIFKYANEKTKTNTCRVSFEDVLEVKANFTLEEGCLVNPLVYNQNRNAPRVKHRVAPWE